MVDLYQASATSSGKVPLHFLDSEPGVPFLRLDEWSDFIGMYASLAQNPLALKGSDGVYTLAREATNGGVATIDFNDKTITFNDLDQFYVKADGLPRLDIVGSSGFDATGKAAYLKRPSGSLYQHAPSVTFDLGKYDIPMADIAGKAYLPLQTVNDVFLEPANVQVLYNGENLFVISGSIEADGLDAVYYPKTKPIRSEALKIFNYNELCFGLDTYYGLKEEHGITSMDAYCRANGLYDLFMDDDPSKASVALRKLLACTFSDHHSAFIDSSAYDGQWTSQSYEDISPFDIDEQDQMESFKTARAAVYKNGVPSYELKGDTAFVTFDKFYTPTGTDYYTTPATSDSKDSFGVVEYAASMIKAAGTAVKNIVLDLSCNGGGELDAAAYVTGWFLEQSRIDLLNTVSGAKGSTLYRSDTNMDREFDTNDVLAGKGYNLYCLTSRGSFSCGNLTPNILQGSGEVKILGQTSGGGACTVLPFSSADGSFFNISGNRKLMNVKNGIYYSNDEGATPDFPIGNKANFYDRDALSTWIDTLK